MTSELDLTADFSAFDGLESIVLRSRDGRRETAIAQALRRSVERSEGQPSNGTYTVADTHWHFEEAAVSTPPELGGSILDGAGRVWRVLAVRHETLQQRWNCRSRELVLAGGLTDVISIQEAHWTKAAAGDLIPAWHDWRVQICARVQPEGSSVETSHRLREARRRFHIYLVEELLVGANHRVLHGGEIYHVLGYERPARIDELFVIVAEQTPWPMGEAVGSGELA
jgi:head-tail adaptor